MRKHLLALTLVLLMGCTSLTPERISLLAAIAGQAAQIGAANWLVKHPDQRPAFDLAIMILSDLVRRGETNQLAYINVLEGLPLATFSGPAGDLNITGTPKNPTVVPWEPKLVIWDAGLEKATVVQGKAEMPVMRATVAGLKRAVAPRPPLPDKLRFK